MKIQQIEFHVDMTAGELPHRTYVSTMPVSGNMFVLISKLLADDSVFFKLYTCNVKTGEATSRMERTTSMEKFQESVKVLEKDLQKVEPAVTLVRQHGESIAVGANGPIDTGNVKGGAEALLKLRQLKEKLLNQTLSPADFVAEVIKDGIMPPTELASLITKFPLELQIQIADRLQNEFAGHGTDVQKTGNHLVNGLKSALYAQKNIKEAMKNPVQPSSRINKFL